MTDKSIDNGIKLGTIKRGEKVLPLIEKIKAKGNLTQELVGFLKGLPPMIKQNGLGQTIAFIMCKKGGYKEILDIYNKVLLPENYNGTLINKILDSEIDEYLYMQNEAIEYAGWMKKFAVAFFEPDKNNNKENEHTSAE
ncbi:MAG: type III-B CRISPR module-associated protein Cmr5 [Candidatus Altiarchaeales archaeon WOR_SM1_79]|nr:MAG: type III-B CRISPR module-associated protein Cmr5 [Candidatus Altiarchaeales archaeon WOR_SM1_79]